MTAIHKIEYMAIFLDLMRYPGGTPINFNTNI